MCTPWPTQLSQVHGHWGYTTSGGDYSCLKSVELDILMDGISTSLGAYSQDSLFLDNGMEQHRILPPNCIHANIYNLTSQQLAAEWLYSNTEDIFFKLFLPIVLVVGITANSALILMVIRVKSMQTITNIYLVNIAIADIVFVGCSCTIYLATYLFSPVRNDVLFRGSIGCAASFGFGYLGYFASLTLLTCVTAERYLAICRPFQHRLIAGKRHTFQMILGSWLTGFALIALVVPRFSGFSSICVTWPDDNAFQTFPSIVHFCVTLHENVYILGEIVLTAPFFITVPIHIYMYVKIYCALANRPLISTNERHISVSNGCVRNQVARLLITNGTVFFMCQASYRLVSVNNIVQQVTGEGLLGHKQYGLLLLISRLLVLINSCVNPFIYVATSQAYRQAFLAAFTTCRKLEGNNLWRKQALRRHLDQENKSRGRRGSSIQEV